MFSAYTRPARRAAMVTIAIGLFFTVDAHSAEQAFDYTGTVTSVPAALTGAFNVGDVISGTYVLDSSTPGFPGTPGSALLAVSEFSLEINGFGVSALGRGDVTFSEGADGVDRYWMAAVSTGPSVAGFSPALHAFQLEDTDGSALSPSTVVSFDPIEPSEFDNPLITLDFVQGTTAFVRLEGRLETVTAVQMVPEPSGMALFMVMGGLAALQQRQRGRKARARGA